MQTNEEVSPILEVVTLLEKNGFRVLKVEEEINSPYSDAINLLIMPKKK